MKPTSSSDTLHISNTTWNDLIGLPSRNFFLKHDVTFALLRLNNCLSKAQPKILVPLHKLALQHKKLHKTIILYQNFFEPQQNVPGHSMQSYHQPLKLRAPIFLIPRHTPKQPTFVPDFTVILRRYFHLRTEP